MLSLAPRVLVVLLLSVAGCERDSPCPGFCDAADASGCVFVFAEDGCIAECERRREAYDARGCGAEWDESLACFADQRPVCDASGNLVGVPVEDACEAELDDMEACTGEHPE